jgi:hypothetical protein
MNKITPKIQEGASEIKRFFISEANNLSFHFSIDCRDTLWSKSIAEYLTTIGQRVDSKKDISKKEREKIKKKMIDKIVDLYIFHDNMIYASQPKKLATLDDDRDELYELVKTTQSPFLLEVFSESEVYSIKEILKEKNQYSKQPTSKINEDPWQGVETWSSGDFTRILWVSDSHQKLNSLLENEEKLGIPELIGILSTFGRTHLELALKDPKIIWKLEKWNLKIIEIYGLLFKKLYALEKIRGCINYVEFNRMNGFYTWYGISEIKHLVENNKDREKKPELSQVIDEYSRLVNKMWNFINAIEKLGESNISQGSVSQLPEYKALKNILEKSGIDISDSSTLT